MTETPDTPNTSSMTILEMPSQMAVRQLKSSTDLQLFCDEFGNTGPRLLQTLQPILVYAFLVVSPAAIANIENEVHALYDREGLPPTELKSSTLLGSTRGRKRYESIGSILSRFNARACLSVVEKRYQACVMIVETYLDPVIHDYVPSEMAQPGPRQRFADACYNWLEDSRLMEFYDAVRSDEPERIAVTGMQISATLELHPDDFVSNTARQMETRSDCVFRYSQSRPGFPKNSHLPASQYAAFYPGVERADAYLQREDVTATLVRDEDLQFGEPLDLAIQHGQHLDTLPNAGDYGARQLRRIRGCRSASSAQELGIQLADLTAGVFGRAACAALGPKGVSTEIEAIAGGWRSLLLPLNEHYWMISDKHLLNISGAILAELAR